MDGTTSPGASNQFQEKLALWVVVSGITVSGICAIVAIVASSVVAFKESAAEAKTILSILLPVIGTWIGTVLAYYFGRENFEAGARQARLTLNPRLDAKAIEKAIPLDKVKSLDVADDKAARALTLTAIDQHMKAAGFSRIPVLTTTKLPLYVVHRQPMDSFLAQQALASKPLANLSLDDLLQAPEGKIVNDSFITLPESATLAEAKSAMEAKSVCQDAFITRSGKPDAPVLAWLTNNEIQRAASG